MKTQCCGIFLVMISVFVPLHGLDWPTYGGPNRNHQSREKTLQLTWDSQEPIQLWEKQVGLGFSSVVEADGLAYTQGYADQHNTLHCIEVKTGKTKWTFEYASSLGDKYFQGGSRSTPTLSRGKIFLQGHEGPLFCLDAKTGKVVWQVHLVNDFGGRCPTWGYAGAPLVDGNQVIVQTGASDGSLVALNFNSGKLLWKAGSAEAGYASPFLRSAKPEQIVVFNQNGLSIHERNSGEELVTHPHKTRYEVNAAQPLDLGDRILIASGYGKGAAMLDLRDTKPKALWEADGVATQMASLVYHQGYAYGIHGQTGTNAKRATLFCLDLASGRKIWEERGYGVGTLILVDKTLVVLSDRGELALVSASPSGFQEHARFHVLGGKNNWTPPSYANGRMHCRSSSGRWICLSMGK